MKIISKRFQNAFTLVEVMVVIGVLGLLVALVMPSLNRAKTKAHRISCIGRIECIGTASRIWAGDNGNLVPAQQTVLSNGWKEILTNGNAGPKLWLNFAALANDLGQSPILVVCPSDERRAAESFTNGFSNSNISYFVGVGANDLFPQSIAGGDRNFGPGPTPDPDYGYSPKDGRGNDVTIAVNGVVAWSLKMHSEGNPEGAGNILLSDGSAQQVSSTNLTQNWLRNAADSGNWPAGHAPAVPSIRLVFP